MTACRSVIGAWKNSLLKFGAGMVDEAQESVRELVSVCTKAIIKPAGDPPQLGVNERSGYSRHLHGSQNTLESAALANQAYLKLIYARGIQCKSPCATLPFRQARRKSGANSTEEKAIGARSPGIELVTLDDALISLSAIDPRKGRMMESRYFSRLSVQETAEVLRISPETRMRDWKMPRAWLFVELSPKEPYPRPDE